MSEKQKALLHFFIRLLSFSAIGFASQLIVNANPSLFWPILILFGLLTLIGISIVAASKLRRNSPYKGSKK